MRGTLTMPALNNGDIDYLTGHFEGVRGTVAGFPLKIVACYLPSSSLMVVSRPDINSVQGSQGKNGRCQLVREHQFRSIAANRQAFRPRCGEET